MSTAVTSYLWTAKFYPGRNGYSTLWLVVHDMEAPEKPTTAEGVARYFADSNVQTSAHYCVDNNSIVQCVHVGDRAWAAGAHGNEHGVHYEIPGYARDSKTGWADAYSAAAIGNTAKIMAEDSKQLNIEPRLLSDNEVREMKLTGIVTHAQLSRCFPQDTTHTDPGVNFPLTDLVAQIHAIRYPASPEVFYTVQKGDTTWAICQKYHLTLLQFLALNSHVKNPTLILPGQKVRVK